MGNNKSAYTVLIADDDANVHQSLGPYFRKEGYQVISAFSGEETLRIVRQSRPDILLLDVMMPGQDGMSLCLSLIHI